MVKELAKIITPPPSPVHLGRREDLEAIQKAVGLALPADYVDMGCIYGTGSIHVGDRVWIRFLNPFDPDFLRAQRASYCPAVRTYLEWEEFDEYEDFEVPPVTFPSVAASFLFSMTTTGTLCAT